jgi:hypothetical protein
VSRPANIKKGEDGCKYSIRMMDYSWLIVQGKMEELLWIDKDLKVELELELDILVEAE